MRHPGAPPTASYWVNQTVTQRRRVIEDPQSLRGSRAPKRLDPTGIGRMITTKINAYIGASPVASGTVAEVEKLQWAQQFGADTLMARLKNSASGAVIQRHVATTAQQ